jgi:hypothetical protein
MHHNELFRSSNDSFKLPYRCLTFGDLRFRDPAVARGFRRLKYSDEWNAYLGSKGTYLGWFRGPGGGFCVLIKPLYLVFR